MNITCKENLTLTGIIGLTLLSSIALTLPSASADTDIVDDVAIEVPAACALTSTLNNNHEKEVNNGVYEPNIGKTTLKVTCNDSGGFSIYAIGFTGDTYTGEDHTKLIGADTGSKISTKVYASSDTTSNWSMKLTPVSGSTISIENSFDDYHVVPDTFTKVATINSGTTPTTGASVETTYSAFMSGTQPADTYTGKVKYTMVHPHSEEPSDPMAIERETASGQICYYANASVYEGTMGCQNVSGSVTLLASNFSREGYGFAGWSDKFDYATNNEAKFYGPNETITLTPSDYQSPNKGLSLYAVWVKSQGDLQDTTKVAELCGTGTNALTTAPTDGTANLKSVSALTDQRDNNTYAIAKLADGKCWMIENLRLESTASHNTDGTLAQGYGTSATYGNFSGLANAESANFSDSTTANSIYYSGTQSGDATINIGTSNYPGYRMPRYNNTNTTARASSPTTNGVAMYSYGNYYTWHAAIADLTYNDTNNSSVTNTSLCPAGWHLPTGGLAYASGSTSGVNVTGNNSTFREFYNLGYKTMDEVKTAYEDKPNGGTAYYSANTTNTAGKTATAAFRSFPNNFLYSGYFFSSSADYRGSYGFYWSSTAYSNISSYTLGLSSSSVTPGTNNYGKLSGLSIRCVSSS